MSCSVTSCSALTHRVSAVTHSGHRSGSARNSLAAQKLRHTRRDLPQFPCQLSALWTSKSNFKRNAFVLSFDRQVTGKVLLFYPVCYLQNFRILVACWPPTFEKGGSEGSSEPELTSGPPSNRNAEGELFRFWTDKPRVRLRAELLEIEWKGMRMQLLLVTIMATSSMAVTTTDGLNWSTHYGKAKLRATAAKRPMVVVIEDPSDVSKRMDDQVLATGTLQKLNKYQLCRVDASTPYGKRVAEAFGADRLPFTAVTDREVKQITYRKAGKMSSEQWTTALNGNTRTVQQAAPVYYSSPTYNQAFCST